MWINWKRYTFGAFLLVSLSLPLFGCSDYGATSTATAPVAKTIDGIVSGYNGLPLAGATITAYAIDANGVQATTPLSINPASVKSENNGSYVLKLPIDYVGSAMVEATLPVAKIAFNSAKQVSLTAGQKIRVAVAKIRMTQTVMLSLATEMAVQYIEKNKGASFLPDNIQKANVVMEAYFGLNFTQTPPPANASAGTKVQQDLLVMIQAFNSIDATIAECVTLDASNKIGLGTYAQEIINAITQVKSDLITAGMIPGTYTPDSTISLAITQAANTPVSEPDSSDTTPPSAPTDLTSTSTASSVDLSWTASTDNTRVTAYYVYRDGVFIAAAIDPKFSDKAAKAASTYTYEVMARDAVGNISAGSKIYVTTADAAPATYVISGNVSINGSALAGVTVAITGDGYSNITTNDSGNYTFAGVRNGEYSVTPSVAGFTFTPSSRTITVNNGNVSVPNFTATAIPSTSYTISGKVSINGTALAGVTVAITGVGSSSLITDGSGNYSFTGVINGNYTITTSRAGYAFIPSSRTFTISNANKPGQDFTAILPGSATGGVTYPDGSVTGVVTYPTGTVTGGVTYPSGTIIGGVTYPSGAVIGGVTYPTATVIGGVTYPTGVVIGGVTYPNGVVIGGVTYPAGTVVGGVAFPVGAVIAGVTYPSGTVIGGVTYPTGTVTGGVIYPGGSVIGTVTYPSGTVIGGVTYPAGTVTGGITYPSGTVIGGVTYPGGTVTGTVTYPGSTVIGGVTYPSGTVTNGVTYPSGSVTATLLYP